RPPAEVVDILRPLGVAVAPVIAVPRMYDDPQLSAREFYQPLEHRLTGTRKYPGWPMHFSFLGAHHRRGAPTLGQHNTEILSGELHLSTEDIDRLAADGVIGDRMVSG